jgi:hypothetical protein
VVRLRIVTPSSLHGLGNILHLPTISGGGDGGTAGWGMVASRPMSLFLSPAFAEFSSGKSGKFRIIKNLRRLPPAPPFADEHSRAASRCTPGPVRPGEGNCRCFVAVRESPVARLVGAAYWRVVGQCDGTRMVEFEWSVIPSVSFAELPNRRWKFSRPF